MNERLRIIRNHFKLSQTKFGAELGVSRDSMNNYELGRVVPGDTFIQLLCSKFNVNEEWLRNGTGDMFVTTPQSIVEDLKKEYKLDAMDVAIIEGYLALGEEERKAVKKYILEIAGRTPPPDKDTKPKRELFSGPRPAQVAASGHGVTGVDNI